MTTDWEESSVTWGIPWINEGGDFDGPALASNSNGTLNVWEDYDITTAVKDIVERGGDNYGFLIKFDSTSPAKQVLFWSSSADLEDKRPKLTITYDPSSAIILTPKPLVTHSAGPYKLSIVSLQGRELSSCEIDDIAQLNQVKSTLSPGVHIVNILTSGNDSFQMKWMIR